MSASWGWGPTPSALLTLPAGIKATMLPNLPGWLAAAHLGFAEALVVAALAVGLFALVIGIPIARLSGSTASITSLGLLIIIHSGAERGPGHHPRQPDPSSGSSG